MFRSILVECLCVFYVFGCPLFESLDKYDISNINDFN